MNRILLLASLGLISAACADAPSPSPQAPSPVPPVETPAPSITLSGIVYENTANGVRPFASVPLDISSEIQSHTPRVASDDAGRYRLSGLSESAVKVAAEISGYSQPCRAAVILKGDAVLDVHLVSNATLEREGVPSSLRMVDTVVSGRVVEGTPQGIQPVAGVKVTMDFSGGFGWAPSANTVTDQAGRFLLCNVADVGLGLELVAGKGGYALALVPVNLTTSKHYDIELVRQ